MILSREKIEELCKRYPPLISPYDPNKNKNNPAGVQLHLGRSCYCSNTPKKLYALSYGDDVVIQPNTIFLFETLERFCIPKNLSGRMSLKMGLVSQGLMMPNQTTIDPGYSNVLFGMLYNLSSEPVTLKYGQAITTLELMETMESQNTYRGKVGGMSFESFVRDRVGSSLGDLEKSIKKADKKIDRNVKLLGAIAGYLSAVLTLLSVVVGVTSLRQDPEIPLLEEQYSELEDRYQRYEDTINEQKELIEELEKKVEALEDAGMQEGP